MYFNINLPALLRALGTIILFFITTGDALAQNGRIAGQVADVTTGDPLPGVYITLMVNNAQRGTVTGNDGQYELTGIPAGLYQVAASMVGYRTAERQVIVEPGSVLTADFILESAAYGLNTVVVSATRMSVPVSAITGSVTVVTQEDLDRQSAMAEGLGEILGQAVPGLAVGTQSMSNYGQSLRGRNVAVLIDGVPQSTLRNVARDFATIDPALVERVEVLRGATAIYGDGATGGVINIITRRPGVGAPSFHTEVGMTGSLSDPGSGLGARLQQSISGSRGPLQYSFSGSFVETGGFYDAEGDLIPPDPHGQGGIADSRSWDVLGKLGFNFGDQLVQLTVNHYDQSQRTEYGVDPSVNEAPPGEQKSRTISGIEQEIPQGSKNTVVSLDYDRAQLLGSRLHVQGYFRDYYTVFGPYDGRAFNDYLRQSFIDSYRWGGRLDIETPLLEQVEASLLWGADYSFEQTSQPVYVLDADLYDASGGLEYQKIDEKIWVPRLRPRSLGLFAQAAVRPLSPLRLQGGIRHERVNMYIDDFTTLAGNEVIGGDLAYGPVLFNVGVVVDVTPEVNVFGSYAQGFSLADIGRVLRAGPDQFTVGSNDLPAPKVNHYEVGLRGGFAAVEFTASGFWSRSRLGTGLRQNDEGELVIDPNPERVYGFETTLDVHPHQRWDLGGTFSWTEGDRHVPTEDTYYPLDGYRIQPYKITAYLENETLPRWTNRLQVLYSGSRDRAFEDRPNPDAPAGYGQLPIEAYTRIDFYSSLNVGPGTFELGINNLLNNHYFDVLSQLDVISGNSYYAAARGASLSLGYSVRY
jgi:iron complex outermembrane recepter protein